MKHPAYLLFAVILFLSALPGSANEDLGAAVPMAGSENKPDICQLWQPTLTSEPNCNPQGLQPRIAQTVEQLIENGHYSIKAVLKLLMRMLLGLSVTPDPKSTFVSLPPGTLYQCGGGGSKSSSASKEAATKNSEKKPGCQRSRVTIAGQNFTLLAKPTEHAEAHHLDMAKVLSRALRSGDKPVGEGATSLVYKVEFNGRYYAVKEAQDRKKSTILLREGCALLGIEHPNIIRLEALAQSDDNCLLVFDYFPTDLWAVGLERDPITRPLPHSEILSYLTQLVSAIDYLHQMDYSHADLKPENVFISASNNIVLADLGNLCGAQRPLPKYNSGIYAAPEVQRGQDPNQSSDIWELGIIIIFLLKPHETFDTLSKKNGYMDVTEVTNRDARTNGCFAEWAKILETNPNRVASDLSPVESLRWPLLSNLAFLHALAVMCLRFDPARRPSAAQLGKVVSKYGTSPKD